MKCGVILDWLYWFQFLILKLYEEEAHIIQLLSSKNFKLGLVIVILKLVIWMDRLDIWITIIQNFVEFHFLLFVLADVAANHKTTTEEEVLDKIAGELKNAPDKIDAAFVERW